MGYDRLYPEIDKVKIKFEEAKSLFDVFLKALEEQYKNATYYQVATVKDKKSAFMNLGMGKEIDKLFNKQIALKPKNPRHGWHHTGRYEVYFANCPACNAYVYQHEKYCPFCGQHIDWKSTHTFHKTDKIPSVNLRVLQRLPDYVAKEEHKKEIKANKPLKGQITISQWLRSGTYKRQQKTDMGEILDELLKKQEEKK